MGPLDMGPYAEMSITTRKSDQKTTTDKEPGAIHVVIALLLLGPALWAAWFIGLYTWSYIGLIIPVGIIGLAIWACGHYGTNRSILDRFRYRITQSQRDRISRRLSEAKKHE